MKNTRSRVPSARRCSWLPAELAAAVVDEDGPVAGSTTDMDVLSSMRRRPRRLVVLDAGDLGRGARRDGAHLPIRGGAGTRRPPSPRPTPGGARPRTA